MANQGTGSKKSFPGLHGARDVAVVPGPAVPARLPRDPAQPGLDSGQPWAESSNRDRCVTAYASREGTRCKCRLRRGHPCEGPSWPIDPVDGSREGNYFKQLKLQKTDLAIQNLLAQKCGFTRKSTERRRAAER